MYVDYTAEDRPYHESVHTPPRVSIAKHIAPLIADFNHKHNVDCGFSSNNAGIICLFENRGGCELTEYMTARELYIFLRGALYVGPYYTYRD